jgi:hypothetical protein
MESLAEGALRYLAFLFSVVAREAAHAFVVLKLGDRTAYEGGTLFTETISCCGPGLASRYIPRVRLPLRVKKIDRGEI